MTPKACSICLKILRNLQNAVPDPDDKDLGTIEDVILRSECQAHQKLISTSLRTDLANGQYKTLMMFPSHGYRGAWISAWSDKIDNKFSKMISVVHSPDDPPDALGSKKLDRQWIDSELPKFWMQACGSLHGPECSRYWDFAQHLSNRPNLLIDTKGQCIVETGSICPPYVALSYVWGQGDFLKTLCHNLSKLKEPGALARIQPDNKQVTTTIQSAMHAVELLGERYLWADALCIVQDDDIFKLAEIQKMHAIYANASLTIVAASSSSSGIAGLHGSSMPRNLHQVLHQFGNRQVVEVSDNIEDIGVPGSLSEESRWSSRGWTFQENLFSPRKLIFTQDSIRWECEKATWIEDQATTKEKSSAKNKAQLPTMLQLKVPDVKTLVTLLNDYARRSLTFEEDALFACAGVFSPLQTSYHGGFISGLPRAFFNSALLWVHDGPATRRRARSEDESKVCLPSWSWAGWQGDFSLRNWEVGNDHLKGSPSAGFKNWEVGNEHPEGSQFVRKGPSRLCSFRSRIQWYNHDFASAEPKQITCGWLQSRDEYPWSTNAPLPPGWERIDVNSSYKAWQYTGPRRGLDREIPKWCFTHESDPTTAFWYPLPIHKERECNPQEGNLSPFISSQTRRGYATCGSLEQTKIESGPQGEEVVVRFCSLVNDDQWMGALEVHDALELADPSNPKSHDLFRTDFELVELGEGWCDEGLMTGPFAVPEYSLPARPKTSGGSYEFYFVLWVEWKSNIAYRRGLGRVVKAAWEAQALDDIQLVLG